MKSKFAGIVIPPSFAGDGLKAFQSSLARMEGYGYDALVVPDTQSIWRDLYVTLSVMALATKRVTLWPAVTNPLTRHPAVAASGIATTDELSGGRAVFNLGSGDSAVYNLGMSGAKLAHMREYLLAIRELYANREAMYQGKLIRLMWPSRPVPIYMTGEGPRTLELAGEIADGVVVGTGLQREVVEESLAHIARGAKRAGRTLDDLDIWWFIKWNMDDDKRAAVREMRMTLTASANHAFRFTLEGKHIPDQYKEQIRRLQASYAFHEHESHGEDRHNAQLVEEAGLVDYLAERFTLSGPPGEFRQKLAGLKSLGVHNFLMAFFGESAGEEKQERFAREVMPHLD